jgi:hypothetical protein
LHPKGATNFEAFERGAGGGAQLPRPFLVIFRDEREHLPLSQASCLQLAEVTICNNRWNTDIPPHPALRGAYSVWLNRCIAALGNPPPPSSAPPLKRRLQSSVSLRSPAPLKRSLACDARFRRPPYCRHRRQPGFGTFLVIFRDEREHIPLSQASCLQLADATHLSTRRNTMSSLTA